MMKKLLYKLLMLSLLSLCACNSLWADVVKIYYVPIGAETFSPVTIENIEKVYAFYGELKKNDRKLIEILNLIQSSPSGVLDHDLIRLKIFISETEVIYIDNNGAGKYHDGREFKLKKSDLSKCKSIIEDLVKPRISN